MSIHACLSRLPVTRASLGFAALGVTLLLPNAAMAQPTQARVTSTAADRACDMSARAITLTLVDDRSGAPITEARVTLWRDSADAPLRQASLLPMFEGRWVLFEDGDLTLGARETVRLWLQVERAGRDAVRRELRVGLDATGCHLELRGDLRELRL
jgi:hypothetical protein